VKILRAALEEDLDDRSRSADDINGGFAKKGAKESKRTTNQQPSARHTMCDTKMAAAS
jgi:hypothetical protein